MAIQEFVDKLIEGLLENEKWQLKEEHLDAINVFQNSDVFSVLDNYDAMKKHLIIRPINFTDHRLALKDYVYRKIGDIALVSCGKERTFGVGIIIQTMNKNEIYFRYIR